MRYLKILIVGLLLAVPAVAAAASDDIPESAVWYFHLDLEQMREEGPGRGVYDWLQIEALSEIKEEAGVDLDKELDRLTAFSLDGQGPILLFEGNISQETKDKIMTFVAAGGDLAPLKASGKTYYHFAGSEEGEDATYGNGDIEIDLEQLGEEAWLSLALKNKVLVTGSEEQMKSMLANGGKVAGSGSHKGALLVLSAEKTMLQAGMNSSAFADDGDSGWDSNILRNTEQVALLIADKAGKLAVEAQLVTTEKAMANSLASIVRGLISLQIFNDDMDPKVAEFLQNTSVDVEDNTLKISVALDPEVVVAAIE